MTGPYLIPPPHRAPESTSNRLINNDLLPALPDLARHSGTHLTIEPCTSIFNVPILFWFVKTVGPEISNKKGGIAPAFACLVTQPGFSRL
jgi:hypothetical protein